MDAIPNPITGRGATDGVVQNFLEMDDSGVILLAQARDDRLALNEVGVVGFPVI